MAQDEGWCGEAMRKGNRAQDRTLVSMSFSLLLWTLPGVLGAAACPAQTPAVHPPELHVSTPATPALWQVKGVHGIVFLFGSVHIMKPDVLWETARIREALKSSDVLYLEVAGLDADGIKAMQPLMLDLGMDPAHPLSTKIPKEDVEKIDAAVKTLGLPGEQALEPMQPWLACLTLSMLPAVKAGYGTDSGVDQKLLAEARDEKKPVKGFETAEEQLHFLADFPQVEQVELLHQTVADLPRSADQTQQIIADWSRGDVEKIASLENDEMKLKAPALYQKLLVDRNEHFAEVLAGLLKNPSTGTVFVTIGAAHLAGPDSVLKMLERRGYPALRVE